MKIIILGMDNSGKTTLANYLKDLLNYPLINSLGPKYTKEEMENFMLKHLKNNKDVIFERFPLFEEIIYGNVLRNESKFNLNDKIYKLLKKDKNLCIIYCRPSRDNILNFGTREQMEGVIEKSNNLINAWDNLFMNHIMIDFNGRFIRYDYDFQNPESLKRLLLSICK